MIRCDEAETIRILTDTYMICWPINGRFYKNDIAKPINTGIVEWPINGR
jgi:hypothetical protein